MYISLQTSSPAARDHARSLILSKDGGRAWLRGGWKDEPNAYDLGRDVGLEGDRELGLAMADAGVSWVEKGTRGMEVVARGLASL
jgi:xanthine/CO dehydrogenase XdhC/CoxF family maturation factor